MNLRRGDVAFGADPFKAGETRRPWLVVSNDRHPFQGEQYVALTLTTRTWHDGFIPLDDADWVDGGTPEESSIVPWGLHSPGTDDLDFWQGRLRQDVVDDAVATLFEYVERPEEAG